PRYVWKRADRASCSQRPPCPPGWRAPPLRLRRGHAAAAPAVGGWARRPARDLPDALPPRSLARPAGDAEDVRPARPPGAAHGLRAAGPRRSLPRVPARDRTAAVPVR